MTEEVTISFAGVSRKTFIAGVIVAILASSALSTVVATQLVAGPQGPKGDKGGHRTTRRTRTTRRGDHRKFYWLAANISIRQWMD